MSILCGWNSSPDASMYSTSTVSYSAEPYSVVLIETSLLNESNTVTVLYSHSWHPQSQ